MLGVTYVRFLKKIKLSLSKKHWLWQFCCKCDQPTVVKTSRGNSLLIVTVVCLKYA